MSGRNAVRGDPGLIRGWLLGKDGECEYRVKL